MPPPQKSWNEYLTDEDLMFLKRFVLASGSLKQVAKEYDISYPTVRLRLDRLIAKIRVVDDQEIVSDFERIARAEFAAGNIDVHTLKRLMAAYQKDREGETP